MRGTALGYFSLPFSRNRSHQLWTSDTSRSKVDISNSGPLAPLYDLRLKMTFCVCALSAVLCCEAISWARPLLLILILLNHLSRVPQIHSASCILSNVVDTYFPNKNFFFPPPWLRIFFFAQARGLTGHNFF